MSTLETETPHARAVLQRRGHRAPADYVVEWPPEEGSWLGSLAGPPRWSGQAAGGAYYYLTEGGKKPIDAQGTVDAALKYLQGKAETHPAPSPGVVKERSAWDGLVEVESRPGSDDGPAGRAGQGPGRADQARADRADGVQRELAEQDPPQVRHPGREGPGREGPARQEGRPAGRPVQHRPGQGQERVPDRLRAVAARPAPAQAPRAAGRPPARSRSRSSSTPRTTRTRAGCSTRPRARTCWSWASPSPRSTP